MTILDPEDSNIKKAQPKEGLSTSGLKTGSLKTDGLHPAKQEGEHSDADAEAEVAKNYAADLSGANGDLKRFRAVQEIAQIELRSAFEEQVFTSADGSAIEGQHPFYTLQSGEQAPGELNEPEFEGSSLGSAIWGLSFDNSESATMALGQIRIGASDDLLEVSGNVGMGKPTDGKSIVLNATFSNGVLQEDSLSFALATTPTEVFSFDSSTFNLTSMAYPFWRFVNIADPEDYALQIATGNAVVVPDTNTVLGTRNVPPFNLRTTTVRYQDPTTLIVASVLDFIVSGGV